MVPRSARAQETAKSLRKLPLFHSAFTTLVKPLEGNRYKFDFGDSAELKDWLWSWLGGIELIPQGEFIQVHHHFTPALVYNMIAAHFQSQSSTALPCCVDECSWVQSTSCSCRSLSYKEEKQLSWCNKMCPWTLGSLPELLQRRDCFTQSLGSSLMGPVGQLWPSKCGNPLHTQVLGR